MHRRIRIIISYKLNRVKHIYDIILKPFARCPTQCCIRGKLQISSSCAEVKKKKKGRGRNLKLISAGERKTSSISLVIHSSTPIHTHELNTIRKTVHENHKGVTCWATFAWISYIIYYMLNSCSTSWFLFLYVYI